MLRCLMDAHVSDNSKCSKCCLYCNEKENCNYKCAGLQKWRTEEDVARNCVCCVEENTNEASE